MLSTSPVIAQMMTIYNIEECSLFAYGTFMVKLVNACLPLLSYSSAMVIILINNVDICRNKKIATILCPPR